MPSYKVLIGVEPKPGTVRRQYPCHEPIEAEAPEQAVALGYQEMKQRGFTLRPIDESTHAIELGLTKEHPLPVELFAFVDARGGELSAESKDGYCVSHSNRKTRKYYFDWEKDVANPVLTALGCELLWCWVDGERDSFGPLSRKIHVKHDGKFYDLIYG